MRDSEGKLNTFESNTLLCTVIQSRLFARVARTHTHTHITKKTDSCNIETERHRRRKGVKRKIGNETKRETRNRYFFFVHPCSLVFYFKAALVIFVKISTETVSVCGYIRPHFEKKNHLPKASSVRFLTSRDTDLENNRKRKKKKTLKEEKNEPNVLWQ